MNAGLRTTLIAFSALTAMPRSAVTQEGSAGAAGRRAVLDPAHEMSLARSAAPPTVTEGARFYVFTEQGFVIADSGTTDVVCLVNRTWPDSLEPECFDAEAAVTIMPMEIRRTELYHRGVAPAQADREIAAGLLDGTFRLPRRPAMVYMMSGAQRLVDDAGKPVGRWRPHLMIYYPFLTDTDIGAHGAPDLRAAVVTDPGRATANLMIVVPEFIEPSGAP